MYETIKERYLKNWVTDTQLERYVTLGALTENKLQKLRGVKNEMGC